jgi:hypothetical protein
VRAAGPVSPSSGSSSEAGVALVLADEATARDLSTFVSRARRMDGEGAVRLVAHGPVLAAYVGVLHGAGGPTVLGLRVAALAEPADVDVTVALAAVGDRLARAEAGARLPLPPVGHSAAWAGVSPPRSGWSPAGTLGADEVRRAAAAGVRGVAAGVPAGAGASAVAQLRAAVWGRPLPGAEDVPSGAALAADALGFLGDEPVSVFATGPWRRLTTGRGHVLARGASPVALRM